MNFHEKLKSLLDRDGRYKPDAYEFVMQSLTFTQKKLKRQGHVSAKELLAGIRDYGINQYGPMTRLVLEHWGIKSTDDFGEIVFNMVNEGILNSTEDDKRSDFANVYEFDKAFDVFGVNRG